MSCSFSTWLELFTTMYASIRNFIIFDFFPEFPLHSSLCGTDGSRIPFPRFNKIFCFIWWFFFSKDWKPLNWSLMWKVTLFFSSTILKYWRDLFSLEILKNARVTSPTHALGVWYIYRHSTLVVFRAGLYRQPFLKFSCAGNYR